MPLSPTDAQALVSRQAKAWETANAEQIVADFAEDCRFVVPGQQLQGRSQVYQSANAFFAAAHQVEITIQRIVVQNNAIAVEWQWQETNRQTGQQKRAEDAIIIELNSQRKIVYWREYIDQL
ncbi:nuclear transport factor 2 family protein [Almyronema epifaneia]|uniref:Nuclear transport factor 2 family protein n=1 Tax=Almyronema epifaneia S1 TaxID=2991925 RepID=A0ABW6IHU0_9CYAN